MHPRSLILAACAALLPLGGCAQGPPAVPGGATEAAVFFTPQVRDARAAAAHVFRSQHAEYARRDATTGVRRASARANLYPPAPRYRSVQRSEYTRIVATDDGYRITERSRESVSTGSTSHRRR